MTFLHATLAAAGLACIAIPIIIHLLMHRRRKPVMWGAMRFLLEAYRRQRRRLMLEKWLLLLCRCLVIGLLGIAIGRPLMGKLLGQGAGRTLYILLDNSLTAGVRADDGRTALDKHKQAARAAIAALRSARSGVGSGSAAGEGDRVGLISLGGPAEAVVMPPSADLSAVERLIDECALTDSRADIAGAVQMIADTMSGGGNEAGARATDVRRTYAAVLSEFREGSLDIAPGASGPALAKLPEGVTLLAAAPVEGGPALGNTTITAVEPLRAVVVGGGADTGGDSEGGNLVRVMLKRSGAELPAAASRISTRIVWPGGRQAGGQGAATQTAVKWTQGQDTAVVVATLPRSEQGRPLATGAPTPGATGGAASGAIIVSTEDDALSADNRWRRPVEFREALRVGVVAPTRFASGAAGSGGVETLDPGSWARLALSPEGENGIDVVDIEPASIDAARLAGLDAVLLPRPDLIQDSGWARLGLFVASGGVIIVTPPPGVSVHLWPDAMAKGLSLAPDWSIGRESKRVEGTRLVSGAGDKDGGGGESVGNAISGPVGGLLALVEGELEALLRPVSMKVALPVDNPGEGGQAILKLDNGMTVMWAARPARGAGGASAEASGDRRASRGLVVYLGVALSLDWSDLPAKPLMVPLVQETVRQGVGQARGSWWMVAGGRPAAPNGAVELRPVDEREPDSQARSGGPGEVVSLGGPAGGEKALRRAGVFAAADERGAFKALIAVNPDPRGGRIQPQTREAVAAYLGGLVEARTDAGAVGGSSRETAAKTVVWLPEDPGQGAPGGVGGVGGVGVASVMGGVFGSNEKSSPIDLPLLIAALLFAVAEIVLARRSSHAEVLPAAVRQAAGALASGAARVQAAAGGSSS